MGQRKPVQDGVLKVEIGKAEIGKSGFLPSHFLLSRQLAAKSGANCLESFNTLSTSCIL